MDYISLWDVMQEKSRSQKKDTGIWDKIAKQYASHTKDNRSTRIAWQLQELNLPSGSSVLDIGAGTGVLAYPLKEAGFEVTVLEPSAVMRESLHGFSIIPESFETAELSRTYDYVISSFSFFFKGFEQSIRKMNEAANHEVHIFWFMRSSSRPIEKLWQMLHHEPYASEPDAEIMVCALKQMGICPEMSVFSQTKEQLYPDEETLLQYYTTRLLAETDEEKEIVKEYLLQISEKTADGYIIREETPAAHLWWKKENSISE